MQRGIVVAVHPDVPAVDLVLSRNGARLVGVEVVSWSASSGSGVIDLPEIGERANKWDVSKKSPQDVIAYVDYVDGTPVVVGFKYPRGCPALTGDRGRATAWHQSGVVTTTDADGNFQVIHPSGAGIVISESGQVEPIGNETRNTDKQVSVFLQSSGGAASALLGEDGAISIENAAASISVSSVGEMMLKRGATMIAIDATGLLTVTGPSGVVILGNVAVTGTISATGNVTAPNIP